MAKFSKGLDGFLTRSDDDLDAFLNGSNDEPKAANDEKNPPKSRQSEKSETKSPPVRKTGNRAKISTQVRSTVEGCNTVCKFLAPGYALTDDETNRLIDALIDECVENPVIIRFFERAGKIAPHAKLIQAVAFIGVPRLLPILIARKTKQTQDNADGTPPAAPMETGGAYGNHWSNWAGENTPSSDPTVSTPPNSGVSEQGGQNVPAGVYSWEIPPAIQST